MPKVKNRPVTSRASKIEMDAFREIDIEIRLGERDLSRFRSGAGVKTTRSVLLSEQYLDVVTQRGVGFEICLADDRLGFYDYLADRFAEAYPE